MTSFKIEIDLRVDPIVEFNPYTNKWTSQVDISSRLMGFNQFVYLTSDSKTTAVKDLYLLLDVDAFSVLNELLQPFQGGEEKEEAMRKLIAEVKEEFNVRAKKNGFIENDD